jgi:hypothetical protein
LGFVFSGSLGSFTLKSGEVQVFYPESGSYLIRENPVSGWKLIGIRCNSGANIADADVADRDIRINLASGETVFCTFTNEREQTVAVTPPPTSSSVNVVPPVVIIQPPTSTPTVSPAIPPSRVIAPPSTGDGGLLPGSSGESFPFGNVLGGILAVMGLGGLALTGKVIRRWYRTE